MIKKKRFNLDKMLSCYHVIIQIRVVNENICGYMNMYINIYDVYTHTMKVA